MVNKSKVLPKIGIKFWVARLRHILSVSQQHCYKCGNKLTGW